MQLSNQVLGNRVGMTRHACPRAWPVISGFVFKKDRAINNKQWQLRNWLHLFTRPFPSRGDVVAEQQRYLSGEKCFSPERKASFSRQPCTWYLSGKIFNNILQRLCGPDGCSCDHHLTSQSCTIHFLQTKQTTGGCHDALGDLMFVVYLFPALTGVKVEN